MNFEEEVAKLAELKTQITDLNILLKEKKEILEKQEYALIKAMDESGLKNLRTEHGGVSRGTKVVYNVTDWDSYIAFMFENGDNSLVQRRPGQKALDDYVKAGIYVPGVEPFEMDKLNFRTN